MNSYQYLTIILLGISASIVGTMSVIKGESLIGDTLSHATYPGVILAFMMLNVKKPIVLVIGGALFGLIGYISIKVIKKNTKLKSDTLMAIVLSTLFGLGMALRTHIQGNKNYSNSSQAGLRDYIFGQAAFMSMNDFYIQLSVFIVILIFTVMFFKEIKISLFDPINTKMAGFSNLLVTTVLIVMTMAIISTGLRAVGAILISSLLIASPVSAMQWSKRFSHVLFIASILGAVGSVSGFYISSIARKIPTGATIIVISISITFLSILFGPHGVILTKIKKRKQKKETVNNG